MIRTVELCLVAVSLLAFAAPGRAATVLTVDLSSSLGPVTHAASGSLYGVTETLPADVTKLIAPLRPRMFNNPAADVQQPVGDAIVVATRAAPTGASVTIRLADWLTGFYTFTNMTDWLSKVGQTVSRKKAAGLTNIYAYEIWNEPGGTYASSNPLPFNEFWRQTYVQLRQLDPGVKITGPSLSFYDGTFMNTFLSFCKTNNCLPDIVGWHELSGANLTGDLQAYRALETRLGIGPLPITINEYSGAGHINVEGEPGASAPLIAKFERFRVDSACISFWDVGHPGRLGSLLATNSDPNGGWWFYKWYGDMAGSMLATTPPTPASSSALDGFANLDAASQTASVLFGGTNDGTIQVVVKGFAVAPFFGSRVHAVVEHTPWVDRTTIVRATDVISAMDLDVVGNQITLSIAGANGADGYRVVLSPVGGAADAGGDSGGPAGSGASGGSGGSGGSDVGTADATDSRGSGGAGAGGAPGTGGRHDDGDIDGGVGAGDTRGEPSDATAGGGGGPVASHGAGGCSCGFAVSPPEPEVAGIWAPLLAVGCVLLARRRRDPSTARRRCPFEAKAGSARNAH